MSINFFPYKDSKLDTASLHNPIKILKVCKILMANYMYNYIRRI